MTTLAAPPSRAADGGHNAAASFTDMNDDPTGAINLDFGHYLAQRQSALSEHLDQGVPDYAFSLDLKLRQQLATLKPVRAFAEAIASMRVPLLKQTLQMEGVAVGPKQYPEVYALVEDCARTLGIGVPEVFIQRSEVLNAYTLATNDVADVIVLHSALIETMEPQELKFIIGHECGHIHNLHVTYNTAAVLLADKALMAAFRFIPGMIYVAGLIQKGALLFLSHWSRCAEITCDRAGAICCGDVVAGQTALAKLATGGGLRLKNINMDQYIQQIKAAQNSPLRLLEMERSHPLTPKRIEALRLWADCDVLHEWRPEMRTTNAPRTRVEIDAQCAEFINVFAKGYERKTAPQQQAGKEDGQ
jgi:Zn-dependent protease with chaperone function